MPTSQATLVVDLRRGDDLVVQHDRDPALRVARRGTGRLRRSAPPTPCRRCRGSRWSRSTAPAPGGSTSAAASFDPLAGQRGRADADRLAALVVDDATTACRRRLAALGVALGLGLGLRSRWARAGARASASATPSTGWNVSCAVRPMTSAASRGSCRPGQLDDDAALAGAGEARLGDAERVDPTAQHLERAVGRLAVGLDRGRVRVSRTIWVPPRRSRPSLAGVVRAKNKLAPMTPSATSARTTGADMPCLLRMRPIAIARTRG